MQATTGDATVTTVVTATVAAPPKVDGRLARAQRTRASVIEALLALIDEGDLRPTAPRIAERAGVSLRSVFQHFDDMESLVTEASGIALARVQGILQPVPSDGLLADRVARWTDQRSRLYEALGPVRRSAALHEPFSPALAKIRQRTQHWQRAEVERLFADRVAGLDETARDDLLVRLEAVTSGDVWDHLRLRSGLSVEAARRALEAIALAVLATPPGP